MTLLDLENTPFDYVYSKEDYADMFPWVDGVCPAKDITTKKWGLIDLSGEWIVAPQFTSVYAYNDGYVAVVPDRAKKWGYANQRREIVIAPTFDEANVFSEGLVINKTRGKIQFIDTNGKVAIEGKWSAALPFSEGLAPVRSGKVWGYINRSGEYVIEPIFRRAFCFHQGRAQVVSDGKDLKSGIIQEYKKDPTTLEFAGRWGTITAQREWVIQPRFEYQESEFGGVSTVPDQKLMLSTPALVVRRVQGAAQFSQGFAPVRVEGLWGYCNETGDLVIAPQYGWAQPIIKGKARVWVYEDKRQSGSPGHVDVIDVPPRASR